MRTSPPSREHGAVERMRNVGVEEVRNDGRGAVGELEPESERGREGERGQRGRERGPRMGEGWNTWRPVLY